MVRDRVNLNRSGSGGRACEDWHMAVEPTDDTPAEVAPAGPGELGRNPRAAIEVVNVRAPTRGNRRLEALIEAMNADEELRTWWHMAQVQSERLRMSDHSWVH